MPVWVGRLPGIAAAVVVMLAGFWLADVLGQAILRMQGLNTSTPISGVPVAIVIGLLLRNLTPLPPLLNPGLKFCVTTVLRIGIVLLGLRLSAFDVFWLGAAGVPVVLAAIATGLIFVTWFNSKLGLPKRLGTLIAAGTSICGVTAIVATAPAIKAEEREVAYAVANVVAFGLFGMLVYPYVAHAWLDRSETIGLFLGTAVHDTSQVVGAALTYRQMYDDDIVLRVATVTKLTRNLFLAGIIPFLAWMYARSSHSEESPRPRTRWTAFVPGFVIGFVAMALIRTIGDYGMRSSGEAFGLIYSGDWTRVTSQLSEYWGSRILLGTAMAAVGLNTSFSVFAGVGARPFVVGLVGALAVGAAGLLMAILMGPYLSM
jgi:uncharacterized integral membrane protein (TIGR00698 family)